MIPDQIMKFWLGWKVCLTSARTPVLILRSSEHNQVGQNDSRQRRDGLQPFDDWPSGRHGQSRQAERFDSVCVRL